MSDPIYVLGGVQTDFKRHFGREGKGLVDLLGEVAEGALEDASVKAAEIDSAHIGNFVAERFCDQGHLGGLLIEAVPALGHIPTSRHEAACASGSMAILAARAELIAGLADASLVVGVELMRHVPGRIAAQHLAAAGWAGVETEGVDFLWPQVFSDLGDVYAERYGLKREHLAALSQLAFENAKRNPLAQTREWEFPPGAFDDDDEKNPVVAGGIRRHDCSQITDGGAAVVLASERFAAEVAARRGVPLLSLPRVVGVGHQTGRMSFRGKLDDAKDEALVLPLVQRTFQRALDDAGRRDVRELDVIETHDCFTTTFYLALDHLGLTPPGESWRAIEDGTIAPGGALPINPSGGLIGGGHPVGATGVRMLLDVSRQVSGRAGAMQVAEAKRGATLNIGGSLTTVVSLVVEAGEAR